MKPPLERIKVSQRSRDTLINLKRKTGIEHWNVLCRWAFIDSLANPNRPVPVANIQESNIEMTWDIFAGDLADYILAALIIRATKDKISATRPEMAAYFRSHLERGIIQLQSAKDLTELFARIQSISHGATKAQKN